MYTFRYSHFSYSHLTHRKQAIKQTEGYYCLTVFHNNQQCHKSQNGMPLCYKVALYLLINLFKLTREI